MDNIKKECRIKIQKNGPYIVTGSVPLREKILHYDGKEMKYLDGKTYNPPEEYALCSCGKSQTPPFCDGFHKKASRNLRQAGALI